MEAYWIGKFGEGKPFLLVAEVGKGMGLSVW